MPLSGLTQLSKAYIGLDLLLATRDFDIDSRHRADGAQDIRTRRARSERSAREKHDQHLCRDHYSRSSQSEC
jgi:hypothetical protein